MAHPADVARGRNIVARWCNLAERRLEHLTELFETGRWRRYHTELEFLENIQEAKTAVETWRDLLNREASLDNTAIDLTWLGRRRTTPLLLTPLPRDTGFRQPVVQLEATAGADRDGVTADCRNAAARYRRRCSGRARTPARRCGRGAVRAGCAGAGRHIVAGARSRRDARRAIRCCATRCKAALGSANYRRTALPPTTTCA